MNEPVELQQCPDGCYKIPKRWRVAPGKRTYPDRQKMICRQCGKFIGYRYPPIKKGRDA